MARIEEISVKNYRVLQNITLKDIKPFSVFLGPNGSGKTTFFDVIGFLSDCLTTNVRKALEKRGRFQEVISRDCQGQEIEIIIKYKVESEPTIDGRLALLFKDAPFSKPFLARFSSDGTLKLLAYLILLIVK
ncbi:MAG: AAA family ATPase [Nostoc sp.]|uniref:AAA family ATPase n=1 Tax=Nostoc sp. TaxID=1180 RepID=UPI002FF7C398